MMCLKMKVKLDNCWILALSTIFPPILGIYGIWISWIMQWSKLLVSLVCPSQVRKIRNKGILINAPLSQNGSPRGTSNTDFMVSKLSQQAELTKFTESTYIILLGSEVTGEVVSVLSPCSLLCRLPTTSLIPCCEMCGLVAFTSVSSLTIQNSRFLNPSMNVFQS